MNADVLTNLNYGDLLNAHIRSGAALTVATHHRSTGSSSASST